MAGRGKKYLEVRKMVEEDRLYELEVALDLVKKVGRAKFEESVELAIKLGINLKKKEEQVRGTVVLPHGTGKSRKVIVFTKGEKIKEAESAGADFVGGDELIKKIQGGWFDFDVAVATPDTMKEVSKLGRLLGPRGLMPNPKSGTVTMEIDKTIKEIKAGKIEYKADNLGVVHTVIGKVTFSKEHLLENCKVLLSSIIKAKSHAFKGQYFRSMSISSTMGPGIWVNIQNLL